MGCRPSSLKAMSENPSSSVSHKPPSLPIHPEKSPASSSAASTSSYSNDTASHNTAPTSSTGAITSITPPRSDPGRPPSVKKQTMSSRITGMFRRDTADGRDRREKTDGKQPASQQSANSMVSTPSSRKVAASSSTNGNTSKSQDGKLDEHGNPKRFTANPDGTHEHYLKAAKRQQRLKDMLRGWWDTKKKEHNLGGDLTLMHDWVTQQNEQAGLKASSDLKGNPTQSQSLVEKYGKCQEIVGHGAFGIVRIAHKADSRDPKKEKLFAVKEFHKRPNESAKRYQKRLTSEYCISSSMENPNVVRTLELLQDDKGDYCEVMEYCAGGDLYTLILTAVNLEAVEADCYFKQLMRGVEYMHELGVAHRDLKPENLLLTAQGCLKITDFGNGECFRMAWEKEAHMTAGLCGSAPYIAPEEYVDKEFDPRAVDLWACGIIYMAMRTGRHLWRVAQRGEDEFFTRYLQDRKEEAGFRPIEILKGRQCRNVIYSVLDPNPVRRLNARQVLQSEWVKDIKVCRAGEGL